MKLTFLALDRVMSNKLCKFKFEKVTICAIEIFLGRKETPSGVDNLDVKILKPAADLSSLSISQIITVWKNMFVLQSRKQLKLFKESFSGKNSHLISSLSKIMKKEFMS